MGGQHNLEIQAKFTIFTLETPDKIDKYITYTKQYKSKIRHMKSEASQKKINTLLYNAIYKHGFENMIITILQQDQLYTPIEAKIETENLRKINNCNLNTRPIYTPPEIHKQRACAKSKVYNLANKIKIQEYNKQYSIDYNLNRRIKYKSEKIIENQINECQNE